jgi:hypothetical protein
MTYPVRNAQVGKKDVWDLSSHMEISSKVEIQPHV